jgi:hypothetical protein
LLLLVVAAVVDLLRVIMHLEEVVLVDLGQMYRDIH